MNVGTQIYLRQKGYNTQAINMNGNYMIMISKDKPILKVEVNPRNFKSQMEFETELDKVIREQINLYETEGL